MAEAKKQDRKFCGILYPDAEDYDYKEVLEVIESYFSEWAWILHDKDCGESGELKKPHIHFIGLLPGPVRISTVSSRIGLPENYIRFADKWKSVVRYLLHDTPDSEEKYHYGVEEVHTNFDVQKFLRGQRVEVQAMKIYDAVVNQGMCTYAELIPWTAKNGCYSELVRAGNMWYRLMSERYTLQNKKREVVKK